MLVSTKICELIKPESLTNPEAEAWEYFLAWIGADGGVYCWLFCDFTSRKEILGDVINMKNENITKLYQNANNYITVVAEDLSENEFDVISNIVRASKVRRYYKDGTFNNVAILTSEIVKPKSQFRYNLQIDIQEIESNVVRN